MDGPRLPGNPDGIVMKQIVKSEAPADLAIGLGLPIKLDQGPLGEINQQVLGIQVVQIASVGPERSRRRGHGLVGGEDGQLGEAALLVVREHLDAGLHGAPEASVLFVDGFPVGDLFQVRPAQPPQHGMKVAAALAGHATAQGQGQRQVAAFVRNLVRLRGEVRGGDPDGIGQQLPGLRVGEERDRDQLAVQRVEDALVAGGDEQPAARAEQVEGASIGRPPDVIEHQQQGLGGEQVAQYSLTLCQRGEGGVATQVVGEVALARQQVVVREALPATDPGDAVRIGLTDLPVAGQRRGEHGLADAAHALHANPGVRAGDDLGLLQVDQQGIAHPVHQLGTAEEVGRQAGYGEQGAERGVGLA